MSLQDIRAMRLAGQKPQGVIAVVVGQVNPLFIGDPLIVQVRAHDQPTFTDWRPLVGCWVAVYNAARTFTQMDAVMEALEKAGAKFYGFAHEGKGYCLANTDPITEKKAAACLRQEWELICL
ncbi:MAG: hypothetical protein V4451_16155 [Pseudomonadota bacterium]